MTVAKASAPTPNNGAGRIYVDPEKNLVKNKKGEPTGYTVVTGIVRIIWPCLVTPDKFKENDTPQYKCGAMFPEKQPDPALMEGLDLAFKLGLETCWAKNKTVPTRDNITWPVKSGNEKLEDMLAEGKDPDRAKYYKDMSFINTATLKQPKFFATGKDQNGAPLTITPASIYFGCYGRLSLYVHPYRTDKKECGITCKLNAIQFVTDGPALGGGASDGSEFGENSAGEEIPSWVTEGAAELEQEAGNI